MKQYKSEEFDYFPNVKPPLHERKAPLLKTSWRQFCPKVYLQPLRSSSTMEKTGPSLISEKHSYWKLDYFSALFLLFFLLSMLI